MTSHLDAAARVFLLVNWRAQQKARGDRAAVSRGIDIQDRIIRQLAGRLEQKLAQWLAEPRIELGLLDERYGWRTELVPQAEAGRARVAARNGVTAAKGGDG